MSDIARMMSSFGFSCNVLSSSDKYEYRQFLPIFHGGGAELQVSSLLCLMVFVILKLQSTKELVIWT